MTIRNETSQNKLKRFCSHANCEVVLKTTYVYPSDIQPETGPRIHQRTCSHYFLCNLQDKSACTFSLDQVNHLPKTMGEITE